MVVPQGAEASYRNITRVGIGLLWYESACQE